MKRAFPAGLAGLALMFTESACSAEDADTSEASVAGVSAGLADSPDTATTAEAPDGGDAATSNADPDWSGIDNAVPEIEAFLGSEGDDYAPAFHFLVVDALDVNEAEGETAWQAAGVAAWATGNRTIVVETGPRRVHIVGDEGLAYFQDEREGFEAVMASHFDRGEYVEGVRRALQAIREFETAG